MKPPSLKDETKQLIDEMIYELFAKMSLEELIIVETQLRFGYLSNEEFENIKQKYSELDEVFKHYLTHNTILGYLVNIITAKREARNAELKNTTKNNIARIF